jgi:hypothetical protein
MANPTAHRSAATVSTVLANGMRASTAHGLAVHAFSEVRRIGRVSPGGGPLAGESVLRIDLEQIPVALPARSRSEAVVPTHSEFVKSKHSDSSTGGAANGRVTSGDALARMGAVDGKDDYELVDSNFRALHVDDRARVRHRGNAAIRLAARPTSLGTADLHAGVYAAMSAYTRGGRLLLAIAIPQVTRPDSRVRKEA